MDLDSLQRDWQDYAVYIDVQFPERDSKAKGLIILKERFFVCFRTQDGSGLIFDPGGHNPRCVTLKPDEDGNCYIRLFTGRWFKIGKFVRMSGGQ